jgi:hypothetical protein
VEYDIPALSAADWLAYLMQPQPDIDGLILDLLPASEELLYSSRLTLEDLYETCLNLIATISARRWWIAMRLISVARDSWHVLGPQMLRKVDVERVSLAGWLDILTVVTLESMDPKDTTMFTMRLEAPPVDIESAPEEMEMSRDAFLSLMR